MITGSRANRKLAGRLLELVAEVSEAAKQAAYSCKPDGYLRSAVVDARRSLKSADEMLGLALQATEGKP